MKRYLVEFESYNGHGWDCYGKDCDHKKQVVSLVEFMLKQLNPCRIIITDTHEEMQSL